MCIRLNCYLSCVRLKDDAKIEAIFNSAIELTEEIGLNKLTMSAIADKANIASGTLYVYFNSKEQLLNDLYKRLISEGTLSLLPAISHLPIKQQLFNIWSNVLNFRMANSAEVAFMHEFRYSPYLSDDAKMMDREFVLHILKLLDAGKEELIVKDLSNDILLPLMYGYVDNLARHLVYKNIGLTPEIIRQTFTICWDAIKA
ncbi:TetR/AcrR family transcriptional regulator [Euzebyella marina]|uniref:TetR/AcrR family transcriptional regulator n=1 Tax=Euzebyella marina TaxID=1761453 RepID=A0A3G2L453_9FLAO|nr:TetR/AcrR family transcriptional regulator [Euzebyella marina]